MSLVKSRIGNLDWKVFGTIACIVGIGIATIYSASVHQSGQPSPLYLRQVAWVGLGLVVFLATALIDYHTMARYAYVGYAAIVVLLVVVLAVGRVGMGAQRWISLGFFDVQPSELAKLVLILVLARYCADKGVKGGLGPTQLVRPLLLAFVPIALILKQPDLGTGLTLLAIAMAMILLVGIRYQSIVFLSLFGLMMVPFAWHLFWNSLKEYQRNRLLTFINPSSDPLGTGYHVNQSKIAIGSGGLWGKGFFGSTQSQLDFLPEGHTDFIFAVFAEEWGFLGVVCLVALYGFLLYWIMETAYKAKDRLGAFLVIGVAAMVVFSLVVNIGMTLGIMPVVGVPLLLMSYGGSSMLTVFAALGLVLNVRLRRFMLFY
ncbi:MAG TPA: rod shape-determining protein RodA [Nitrospiria bacterium]|nr:rod shape-determining protein RodA [Nitrospiria bacterium]